MVFFYIFYMHIMSKYGYVFWNLNVFKDFSVRNDIPCFIKKRNNSTRFLHSGQIKSFRILFGRQVHVQPMLIHNKSLISNYLLNKIKNILIIHKFYIAPINFLFCVLFLLHLEYMLLKLKQYFYIIIHLEQ